MDTTDSLERELAELSAHIEVATHRQLALLRALEPTAIWVAQHAASFAHWLSWRIGLAPGVAREKIRVARALGALPAIDAAFADGRLSYSKVRALTRVATERNESVLLEMALGTTAAHLERICRGIRRADLQQRCADDEVVRWVRQRQGDHGMMRIEAQLHPDEAAIVIEAIERARASRAVPEADALVAVARAFRAEDDVPARAGAEVVVHVREEMVEAGAIGAALEDGTRVPAETLRRVACDCVTQPVAVDGSGLPIDVGRKRRLVPPRLRRALLVRDGCCRFPGCANRGWLDAHHVEHWLHGGETTMSNLIMLCPFHHRLVHEGGYRIEVRDLQRPVFHDPHGQSVRALPRSIVLGPDAVRALKAAHVSAGTSVDDETLVPEWDGSMPDIAECVEAAL